MPSPGSQGRNWRPRSWLRIGQAAGHGVWKSFGDFSANWFYKHAVLWASGWDGGLDFIGQGWRLRSKTSFQITSPCVTVCSFVHSFIHSFIHQAYEASPKFPVQSLREHPTFLGDRTIKGVTASRTRIGNCSPSTTSGPLHFVRGKKGLPIFKKLWETTTKTKKNVPRRPSSPQSLDYLPFDLL